MRRYARLHRAAAALAVTAMRGAEVVVRSTSYRLPPAHRANDYRQAVRAGGAAGWSGLPSCVQPLAAPQCGYPPSSTRCACDQAARLISGSRYPLVSKGRGAGRGAWLAPAAAGESGSRGAARLGHPPNAPLPPLPGGQQEMLTGYPPGC
jgi:hypothetical protein